MSSIFLRLIFWPVRLLVPAVGSEGRKMGGEKMKSKSSCQLFWDATWKNMVTHCTHVITNAVAEGINSKIMAIQRRAGSYRNIENIAPVRLMHISMGPSLTGFMFYRGRFQR